MKKSHLFYILIIFLLLITTSNVKALSYGRVTYSTGINLRTGPGTNYTNYTKASYNDVLTIENETLAKSEKGCVKNWYKVNYNGKTVYACSNYISLNQNIGKVNYKNGINIRSGAGSNYSKYGTLSNNTLVTITDSKTVSGSGCSKGWYKIHYNTGQRYVCSNYITQYKTAGNAIITNKNGASLKSSTTTSSIYKTLKYKEALTIYDDTLYKTSACSTGFYKVYYKGNIKYICSSDILKTIYNGKTTDSVNVRNSASSNGTKYTTLDKNTYVLMRDNKLYEGSGCSDGWFKIKLDKQNRYICSTYVKASFTPEKSTTPQEETTSKKITARNTTHGSYYTINKWTYRVNEDYAYIRSSASTSSTLKDTVYLGTELEYLGSATGSGCSDGWYKVKYYNNKTGYICKTYVDKYENITKKDSTYCNELKNKGFHESYCPYLSYLHSKHPKWQFIAEKSKSSFLTTINKESLKNYTQNTKSAYLYSSAVQESGGWRTASDGYVAFMIDPRNYLNEKNIFAFESQSYESSYQTSKVIRDIFNGTWLDTDEYAGYYINAGKTYGVSPVLLASRSKQEGATNSSYDAVSGTVKTRWDEYSGYICSSYAKLTEKENIGTIKDTSYLTVRKGPGTNKTKLAYAKENSTLILQSTEKVESEKGCSAGWYKIKLNNDTGYVCSSYVSVGESKYKKGTISSAVNVRSGAGTNYSQKTTANVGDTFTLSSNTKYKSSKGCSAGWYKIKADGYTLTNMYNFYNIGSYGTNPVIRGLATAAGYVDSNDGTPWNTREKAIKYGASFIGKGYIKEGQDTLFYQKFNVAEKSTSTIATHQYMTNILAPASEALSAYRSYKDLNMLDTSFVFRIPVYSSMPTQITTHPVVK